MVKIYKGYVIDGNEGDGFCIYEKSDRKLENTLDCAKTFRRAKEIIEVWEKMNDLHTD